MLWTVPGVDRREDLGAGVVALVDLVDHDARRVAVDDRDLVVGIGRDRDRREVRARVALRRSSRPRRPSACSRSCRRSRRCRRRSTGRLVLEVADVQRRRSRGSRRRSTARRPGRRWRRSVRGWPDRRRGSTALNAQPGFGVVRSEASVMLPRHDVFAVAKRSLKWFSFAVARRDGTDERARGVDVVADRDRQQVALRRDPRLPADDRRCRARRRGRRCSPRRSGRRPARRRPR